MRYSFSLQFGWSVRRLLFVCLPLFLVSALIGAAAGQEKEIVLNPYEDVQFSGEHQKSNFHTHTTESDGSQDPGTVIDGYHEKQYDVLALTDHNHVTWPWTDYGQNPVQLGMIPIPGNELSKHDHNLSLFSRYPDSRSADTPQHLETAIKEVTKAGGLNVLAHPGRYWKPKGDTVPEKKRKKYVGLFTKFDKLIGMEVHNQTDRYPHDRRLWDALLETMMPDRPIWGFANDDSHGKHHIGLNANWFPMQNLDHKKLRASIPKMAKSMMAGAFYFSTVTTHPEGDRDLQKAPKLTGVTYDAKSNTLTIEAEVEGELLEEKGYTWISNRGDEVAKGPSIDLSEIEDLSTYLRAELRSDGALTYTQPFGLQAK